MKNTNKTDKNTPRKIAVFDFGHVLFQVDQVTMYREMLQADNKTEEDLQYFLTNIFTNADRSRANNLKSAKEVTTPLAAQHPEWAKYIEEFNADRGFMRQIPGMIDGMKNTLQELKSRGYELYGLTNWSGDTFDKLQERYPDITGLFNKIVVSGKVGVKKPNPEIYKIAQAEFGNPDPDTVYFFDDKETNTAAAKATVGWKGVTFKDVHTVRKTLGL